MKHLAGLQFKSTLENAGIAKVGYTIIHNNLNQKFTRPNYTSPLDWNSLLIGYLDMLLLFLVFLWSYLRPVLFLLPCQELVFLCFYAWGMPVFLNFNYSIKDLFVVVSVLLSISPRTSYTLLVCGCGWLFLAFCEFPCVIFVNICPIPFIGSSSSETSVLLLLSALELQSIIF